jgi:DNA-binding transcriptional MerR regulator
VLAEPERDASGYRRYDAQAVIDLIRIKTLAAAGVPLVRVRELLDAEPSSLNRAVEELDHDLARRIKELTERRRRIADLTAGERLYLPAEVVAILDRERKLGHSERMIRVERNIWIMAVALTPNWSPSGSPASSRRWTIRTSAACTWRSTARWTATRAWPTWPRTSAPGNPGAPRPEPPSRASPGS